MTSADKQLWRTPLILVSPASVSLALQIPLGSGDCFVFAAMSITVKGRQRHYDECIRVIYSVCKSPSTFANSFSVHLFTWSSVLIPQIVRDREHF